jgi:hypothetical protein
MVGLAVFSILAWLVDTPLAPSAADLLKIC